VRSAFGEFQARASNEVCDHSGYQNFAWLRLRHYPGGCVDRYAADISAPQFDLARVKARTQR
jgi:hypothetical protein